MTRITPLCSFFERITYASRRREKRRNTRRIVSSVIDDAKTRLALDAENLNIRREYIISKLSTTPIALIVCGVSGL